MSLKTNVGQNVCNEKSDWIENTPDATTQEFITQKAHLDDVLSAIWIKLSEPRKFFLEIYIFVKKLINSRTF